MREILLSKVMPGVLRLAGYITLGVLLGWVFEALGLLRRLAVAARPMIRVAKLPPVCAAAFVTTFASPKAAGGMLSAAYTNKEIERSALILGAVANSVASGLMHLRVAGPMLIATLGAAGAAYVAFTILNGLIVLGGVLLVGHVRHQAGSFDADGKSKTDVPASAAPLRADWRVAWTRWRRLLPRVLLVAIPVYILVAYLNESGAFTALGKKMPPALESSVSPATMAVVVMQMTSTTRAAPVAREFLDSGELTAAALFFALVLGYTLSLPVRVLRRNLPTALTLYPGRNGLWITLFSQGVRFTVALAVVVTWLCVQTGRTP